jgi:hypothetical protein
MMNKQMPGSPDPKQPFKKKPGEIGSTQTAGKKPIEGPVLLLDSNGTPKIPLAMRQRYLKIIFDNGRGLFTSVEKACEKAAQEEKSIYDRAKNKTIYINLSANLIKSLRTQQQQVEQKQTSSTLKPSPTIESSKSASTGYSHEAMLSGPKANKVSYSINRFKQIEHKDLSGKKILRILYFHCFLIELKILSILNTF